MQCGMGQAREAANKDAPSKEARLADPSSGGARRVSLCLVLAAQGLADPSIGTGVESRSAYWSASPVGGGAIVKRGLGMCRELFEMGKQLTFGDYCTWQSRYAGDREIHALADEGTCL